MKLLRKEKTQNTDAHMRFEREARVQGQLEHPAIVPVYDLGVRPDGTPFFTMKRLHGETLAEILDGLQKKNPSLTASYSQRRLLAALSRVALAVAFANSRGVLHRDLKPSNVMLGDFGEVYLLDLGPPSSPAPTAGRRDQDRPEPEGHPGRRGHGGRPATCLPSSSSAEIRPARRPHPIASTRWASCSSRSRPPSSPSTIARGSTPSTTPPSASSTASSESAPWPRASRPEPRGRLRQGHRLRPQGVLPQRPRSARRESEAVPRRPPRGPRPRDTSPPPTPPPPARPPQLSPPPTPEMRELAIREPGGRPAPRPHPPRRRRRDPCRSSCSTTLER